MKHGTSGGYTNHGCRCDACRAANAARQRRWRANRGEMPSHVHGTVNGYKNYGCRCWPCTKAGMDYRRARAEAAELP